METELIIEWTVLTGFVEIFPTGGFLEVKRRGSMI